MPGKNLFEYAVIRVVPRVEREEFINVGVVLFCRDMKFLRAGFAIDEQRIKAFSRDIDIVQLVAYLLAFRQICEGDPSAGPISRLPMIERFRWLTAARSTILQTSCVHSGLCDDPAKELEQLFKELVE